MTDKAIPPCQAACPIDRYGLIIFLQLSGSSRLMTID